MTNRDLKEAWAYHNGTKHSYHSTLTSRHYLDWDNQPRPFKSYVDLDPIYLPEPGSSSGVAALSAIAALGPQSASPLSTGRGDQMNKKTLAEILFLTAGITRRRQFPGGEILFRAAACTGALYHIDLYVVCGGLADLEAGVYHFAPDDFALRMLRAGDYRSFVNYAAADEAAVADAQAVVVFATTYWRNTWKYQSRTYRHCFWDSGTMLANLLAVSAAREWPCRVLAGFVDRAVNGLLGLEEEREAALVLVPLGRWAGQEPVPAAQPDPLRYATLPLSMSEVDYPMIRAMHAASSLETAEEVAGWRGRPLKAAEPGAPQGRSFPLHPLVAGEWPADSIEDVIRRRGSTRTFAREAIGFHALSTILIQSTRGIPADFLDGGRLNQLYLIVNAVDGIPAGAYAFHPERRVLELLKEGEFRAEAGHLGLGQEIPADASVNVYFLTDLREILERFGNRGYRAAQLEAATAAGKMYLAAYAQGLGASGLTFFDDEVTDFFSPSAAGKSVMFLLALGKALRHARK